MVKVLEDIRFYWKQSLLTPNLSYEFSKSLKSPNLRIENESRIACEINSNNHGNADGSSCSYALLEPSLLSSHPHKIRFRFRVFINNQNYRVGLGVCHKRQILNFNFTNSDA